MLGRCVLGLSVVLVMACGSADAASPPAPHVAAVADPPCGGVAARDVAPEVAAPPVAPRSLRIEERTKPERDVALVSASGEPTSVAIGSLNGLESLRGVDELVVRAPRIVVALDYPLHRPAEIPIDAPTPRGFRRRDLVQAVRTAYVRVYREEEATTTVPARTGVNGVLNRTDTDGTHGIWGHDLGDLFLESLELRRGDDGTIYLLPGVGS